jgi:hypothetical protein
MIDQGWQDAKSQQGRQDAELKTLLLRNDPAGVVTPEDSARLQMFIADRVFHRPQYASRGELYEGWAEFFIIPAFLRGPVSWPATLAGTMAVGLLLGFFVSSLADMAAPVTYNVAMTGPWQQLMQ